MGAYECIFEKQKKTNPLYNNWFNTISPLECAWIWGKCQKESVRLVFLKWGFVKKEEKL